VAFASSPIHLLQYTVSHHVFDVYTLAYMTATSCRLCVSLSLCYNAYMQISRRGCVEYTNNIKPLRVAAWGRHSSGLAVNLADYMDDHDEEKKREQNITVRSGKYVDEVTNNRRLH